MKTLLVAIIFVLFAAPSQAQDAPLHLALGAYMTLNGVDLAQTMACVGSGQCREANRFMAMFTSHPATFGALKIGLDSAAVYAVLRLHKTHPKLAWMVTAIGIGAETAATVHNAKVLRTGR